MSQTVSVLEDLLRGSALALEVRLPDGAGVIEGTGFMVAPGIVATCAHVLAERREKLPGSVTARTATGRELALEPVAEWYMREHPGDLDLAFLRAPLDAGLSHVLLCDLVESGETMWTFGYPAGKFRAGQSALFTAQGPSQLRAVDSHGHPLDGQWQPQRVFGTPVGGGYSGSAVLSRRTGAVCGMLCSSNNEGSAHMVSAADLVAALPQVTQLQSDPTRNTRWLEQLNDEQIRIGGWPYPGPLLRAYLDAALDMAQDHLYPGIVPGTQQPLSAVHRPQQAQPVTTAANADTGISSLAAHFESPSAVAAQEIVHRDGDAVVIAGPGGGKTTLLRAAVITLAESWRSGQGGRWIPVHVPAVRLVPLRPLHEAIAASISTDLRVANSTQEWPASFFKTVPMRGMRWLVMVDGLDEITSPETRLDLVKMLARESARPDSSYRFLATTRPLSPDARSSDPLGKWTARRYELLPFADEDLSHFAKQWFTAENLPDPEGIARNFSTALQVRGLDDLARTPLIATMLCQVYGANPTQPLPGSRTRIYEDFLRLVRKRQRAAGLRRQTRASLYEYGKEALSAADNTLEHLHALVAFLAAKRHAGSLAPALHLIASHPRAARPTSVPEDEWRSFLEESLRTSCLLTVHAGEAEFLHHTLLEYLAAQHALSDDPARAYKALDNPERCLPGFKEPGVKPHIWGRRFWMPPEERDSYIGFLIDIGYSTSAGPTDVLERLLKRLATQGGLAGAEFIARQVQLGTLLPQVIPQAAADTLCKFAYDPGLDGPKRVEAAQALASLDALRGRDLLEHLARDPHLDAVSREQAAKELASLDDPRGADLLEHLACDHQLPWFPRMHAAESLAWLGDQRGSDLLDRIARDEHRDPLERWQAASSLSHIDPPRGADVLDLLAHEPAIDWICRLDVVQTLAFVDPSRGADLFDRLARDPHCHPMLREQAAHALARLDPQRGADVFASKPALAVRWWNTAERFADLADPRPGDVHDLLARDHGESDRDRLVAAEHLADLGDSRAADALDLLARDSHLGSRQRVQAAERLADLDQQRAGDVLDLLSRELDRAGLRRLEVAEKLVDLGDPRAATPLYQLALDTRIDGAIRLGAAERLADIGDSRAADALDLLARDPDLYSRPATEADNRFDSMQRVQAAKRLAGLNELRASNLLDVLARRHDVDDWHRLDAARALANLGDSRAADALDVLARDSHVGSLQRVEAGKILADLGDQRAADLLERLARDSELGWERVEAAEALAALRGPSAADLLVLLAQDESLGTFRLGAARALAELGDPRGADLLDRLSTAPDLYRQGRWWAVIWKAVRRRGSRR
ncbi:HEAT repeat domain-containing protein [Streptomyces sp. NPDC001178]